MGWAIRIGSWADEGCEYILSPNEAGQLTTAKKGFLFISSEFFLSIREKHLPNGLTIAFILHNFIFNADPNEIGN